MGNLNNPQLLILLLFMGLSFASWLFGQLREQRRIKRARDESKRRYEEHLRTGRPLEGGPAQGQAAPARQTLTPAELAARRQAQLREARRLPEERPRGQPGTGPVVVRVPGGPGAGGVPGTAPGPGRVVLPGGIILERIPGSSGPTVPPRRPAPAAPARPVPTPIGGAGGSGSGRGAGGVTDQRAQAQRRRDADQTAREQALRRGQLEEDAEEQARLVARRAAEAAAARNPIAPPAVARSGAARQSFGLFFDAQGRPLSLAERRRLIIAGEVLGRPLADRLPGS